MGYNRGDNIPFDFEPNGNLFGSKLKGKLSPRSYPIQFERKWKYSFLSVQSTDFAPDVSVTLAELHCKSRSDKPNLDCNYTFPIGLAPNVIPFGVNSILNFKLLLLLFKLLLIIIS